VDLHENSRNVSCPSPRLPAHDPRYGPRPHHPAFQYHVNGIRRESTSDFGFRIGMREEAIPHNRAPRRGAGIVRHAAGVPLVAFHFCHPSRGDVDLAFPSGGVSDFGFSIFGFGFYCAPPHSSRFPFHVPRFTILAPLPPGPGLPSTGYLLLATGYWLPPVFPPVKLLKECQVEATVGVRREE